MSKSITICAWSDVPHLSQDDCSDMLKSFPAYQRRARAEGIPMLGAGAIYPFEPHTYVIDPIKIPEHWPRGFGFDVGWNKTAAIWGAHDRESDTVYLWSEHYLGEAEPAVHAHSINKRGDWIPGRIDPASRGRGQADGRQLLSTYRDDFNLLITEAPNMVESGIFEVYTRLSEGRLKIFSSLRNTLSEIGLYRRDIKGKVIKDHDHLMDAIRYMIIGGVDWMATEPSSRYEQRKGYGWQV